MKTSRYSVKFFSGFLILGIRNTRAAADSSGKINTILLKSVERKNVTKGLSVLLFDSLSLWTIDYLLTEYM